MGWRRYVHAGGERSIRGRRTPFASARTGAFHLGPTYGFERKSRRGSRCRLDALKNLYEVHGRQPLFDNFGGQTTRVVGIDRAPLVDELRAMAPSERFERLARPVQSLVADVLRLDADQTVEREVGFFDMGVDSLMAVQIKDRIQQLVGRELTPSLCFDYPTIVALIEHLLRQLFPESETDESDLRILTDVRPVSQPPVDECRVEDMLDEQIAALIDEEMKALNLE